MRVITVYSVKAVYFDIQLNDLYVIILLIFGVPLQ